MRSHALLDELQWRGLLYQHTEGVADLLATGQTSGYVGFDPTADSLHIGSLVPVMALVHLQRSGHRPVVLVGGGTGLIGDPSGKASERTLQTTEKVAENAAAIGRQLARFVDFDGARGAIMVDNAEWLTRLGAIEFMRDVGKHFTVNYMLQKESVSARMDAGISYTEFSYMLLQGYDFLELYRRHGVRLQMGGSDQWGNMTAGMELIRRVEGGSAHVITCPLVTTAAGTKFGKTEAGAVWLDPARTSAYEMYQYWINVDDRDVGKYLRYFTLLPREEIEALDRATAEQPEKREAQQTLARDVTRRVHGEAGLTAAERVTRFNFGGLDPRELGAAELEIIRRQAPYAEVSAESLAPTAHDGAPAATGEIDVVKLLVASTVADSNGAARRLLQQGGVSINKRKLSTDEKTVRAADVLLAGEYVIVGKGKREYALVRVLGAGL